MKPHAGAGIGDLVMVLQEVHVVAWLEIEARRTSRSVLPIVFLALKQISVFGSRQEFRGLPAVVVIVGFMPACQGDDGGMVKVVIPQGVEIIALLLRRPDHPRLLWLVLADKVDLPFSGCCPRL